MVDIHCHILPGVDDGSPDWPTTLEMCRIAVQDGITHIAATPHANSRYPYDRARHQELLSELQSKVPDLAFSLGCDFNVSFENVEAAARDPHLFTLGNSPFILAEPSDYATPVQMKDLLFRLHCAGLKTVITHPERNPIFAAYKDLAAEVVDMGSLLQITADSLVGAWGRTAKKLSEKYLAAGLVSVIASDAHETRRRIPALTKARKAAAKIVGEDTAALLVNGNPAAILSWPAS